MSFLQKPVGTLVFYNSRRVFEVSEDFPKLTTWPGTIPLDRRASLNYSKWLPLADCSKGNQSFKIRKKYSN